MSLNYQIAKDYLSKLPESEKIKLCNRTLGQVKEQKQTKNQIRKYCSNYIKNEIKTGKL